MGEGCRFGGGAGVFGLGGGQDGCKRRIEVFVKIHKNGGGVGSGGGGYRVGGVRVDVNEELKFLRKFKKKMGGSGLGGGVGFGLGGVRVDVNEELKFLRKFTQKKFVGGGVWRGGQVGGSGVWGAQGGCKRNVWGRG